MKKFYIFHGTGGSSAGNWFPWLKEELEHCGCEVLAPDFPNSENPNLTNWLNLVNSLEFDQDCCLIGHSLGATLILRFLEKFPGKVDQVYLVGGAMGHLGWPNLVNSGFFEADFPWHVIKNKANKFFVLTSDDDPFLNINHGEKISRGLGVQNLIFPKTNHFMIKEFPELLELIKKENEIEQ